MQCLSQVYEGVAMIGVVDGAVLVLGLFVRPGALITAVEMLAAYVLAHTSDSWNPLANKGEAAVLFFAPSLVLLTQVAKNGV